MADKDLDPVVELGAALNRATKYIGELERQLAEARSAKKQEQSSRDWQSPTRTEILKLANEAAPPDDEMWLRDPDQCVVAIARAIEQKLKEKNA